MHGALSYLIAVIAGVVIAYFITREAELRAMRLAQFVLLPIGLVLFVYFMPHGDESSPITGIARLMCFLAVLAFLVVLLAPHIAYLAGVGLSSFLDNYDWTPAEEEIALRPIRVLIQKDSFRQALAELDELLTKHKPTYEAVLTRVKLLHHIGRVDETVASLPGLIRLSQSTAQQLAVMELLDFLQPAPQTLPTPPAAGTRRMEIHHGLVLFPTSGEVSPLHKTIPCGTYEVQEINHHDRRWLKLARDDWGNVDIWWEAVAAAAHPAAAAENKGLFHHALRINKVITAAIKGKSRRERLAESQKLFQEAKELIRREDWHAALPLLEKASTCDPDRYEIAYRRVLAVRHTGSDDATARAVDQALRQSDWTKDEQDMLNQLKWPQRG